MDIQDALWFILPIWVFIGKELAFLYTIIIIVLLANNANVITITKDSFEVTPKQQEVLVQPTSVKTTDTNDDTTGWN